LLFLQDLTIRIIMTPEQLERAEYARQIQKKMASKFMTQVTLAWFLGVATKEVNNVINGKDIRQATRQKLDYWLENDKRPERKKVKRV
jgi:predicted XRE-type DNA-binding protein